MSRRRRYLPESLSQEKSGPGDVRLYVSRNHMFNFLECVRTRRPTIAPVEVAALSDTIVQLSMIAIQTGRKIRWDPRREAILDDPGASRLMTRSMRGPWHL